MADARQPFQVFLVESAKQVVQRLVAFAPRGAFEVRAADAVRISHGERQRPAGDAVGERSFSESAQRDHRAADEIISRGR